MSTLTLGSLFSGSGGLDLAIHEVLGTRTAWVSDIEQRDRKGVLVGNAPAILANRFPGVPNLGDVTTADWSRVPRVDVVAGGSPCQDVSAAGKRAGMTEGTRSNLWVAMREAIAVLEPSIVIWENVYGALSARAASAVESEPGLLGGHAAGRPALRAAGRVVGDLASLGFDAWWCVVRACDVGAPHQRARLFVLAAHPARLDGEWWESASRQAAVGRAHAEAARRDREPVGLLPTPLASDGVKGGPNQRGSSGNPMLPSAVQDFGPYAEAVSRWERAFRPAPYPTEPGVGGRPRLSARFAEWMMGLPDGWVTGVPGLSRNQQIHAIGNGVVPQQAGFALRFLLRASGLVEPCCEGLDDDGGDGGVLGPGLGDGRVPHVVGDAQ